MNTHTNPPLTLPANATLFVTKRSRHDRRTTAERFKGQPIPQGFIAHWRDGNNKAHAYYWNAAVGEWKLVIKRASDAQFGPDENRRLLRTGRISPASPWSPGQTLTEKPPQVYPSEGRIEVI
jgi:hypothetical protein